MDKTFYVVIILLSGLNQASSAKILSILSTVNDVIAFGKDVYSFFEMLLGDDEEKSTPAPIDYERIIDSISERIDMSTKTIVFKIELQSYISELRTTALVIKRSLSEMEDIIQATDPDIRKEYQRRFHDNFERHKTDIYKIENLLSFTVDISGASNTLLSVVAGEFNCGMSQLEEFQNYYMALVSDAVALSLLNEKLSVKSLYEETLSNWEKAIATLLSDINKQKDECKAKFLDLATKDFETIDDPEVLFENNQDRYSYKTTDALFIGGSYCLIVLQNYTSIFQKERDSSKTLVVVSEAENKLSHSLRQYRKMVEKSRFEDCKEHSKHILSDFNLLGQDLVLWLMYPTAQEADHFVILFDKYTAAGITNTQFDNTMYTIIVYKRSQSQDTNSTVHFEDYTASFYKLPATDSSLKLAASAWIVFGLTLAGGLCFK